MPSCTGQVPESPAWAWRALTCPVTRAPTSCPAPAIRLCWDPRASDSSGPSPVRTPHRGFQGLRSRPNWSHGLTHLMPWLWAPCTTQAPVTWTLQLCPEAAPQFGLLLPPFPLSFLPASPGFLLLPLPQPIPPLCDCLSGHLFWRLPWGQNLRSPLFPVSPAPHLLLIISGDYFRTFSPSLQGRVQHLLYVAWYTVGAQYVSYTVGTSCLLCVVGV